MVIRLQLVAMISDPDAGAAVAAVGREQIIAASAGVNPVPSASDRSAALLARRLSCLAVLRGARVCLPVSAARVCAELDARRDGRPASHCLCAPRRCILCRAVLD
jgi:hypothetical protein